MKILLVEDHDGLAFASCLMLREMHHHEVERAATAAAALEAAASGNFDLALLDINLPDLDGYRLAAKLREKSQSKEMVLVALTAIGDLIDRDLAAASGIDMCFTKPMDFGMLENIRRQV